MKSHDHDQRTGIELLKMDTFLKKFRCHDLKIEESKKIDSCQESNPGHQACTASALPLSYGSPHNPLCVLHWVLRKILSGCQVWNWGISDSHLCSTYGGLWEAILQLHFFFCVTWVQVKTRKYWETLCYPLLGHSMATVQSLYHRASGNAEVRKPKYRSEKKSIGV